MLDAAGGEDGDADADAGAGADAGANADADADADADAELEPQPAAPLPSPSRRCRRYGLKIALKSNQTRQATQSRELQSQHSTARAEAADTRISHAEWSLPTAPVPVLCMNWQSDDDGKERQGESRCRTYVYGGALGETRPRATGTAGACQSQGSKLWRLQAQMQGTDDIGLIQSSMLPARASKASESKSRQSRPRRRAAETG
ncbi:uncharacterized protein G6M90_00g059390 [Metarhizium brunneum]|uniref:Uncharacterized protein n=1 Tax=Metarhizium brunneum TaxID=500148 RepID=A0A7D5YR63_9HYPO